MPLIQISDQSLFVDHPFADPFLVPDAGNDTWLHIFPGDEILLQHKVTLPGDAGAALISDIQLISAKASILAKKPQVFSEEFSLEFLSTRTMELDSISTSFNAGNAIQQLWGADGYAPNIHLSQDRNWKLPSGDLRRQIKFFTDHTSPSASWDYYFYFPIIFRWEKWIALLNANSDFFDLAQPQDGMNQWWYHYYNAAWSLFSRLEIVCLVNGVRTVLRLERSLTPITGFVNNYSSNLDYRQKAIRTSKIGGTLTSTPALIYANSDNRVVAAFKKLTAWEAGEKANISGVLWIEPFEGSGITARTRGSSVWPITPESVFKGLALAATDDDGIAITDAAGQYIVFDSSGKGAKVVFDPVDDTKIQIVGVIDYQKLLTTYPGVTKFTAYARLYNSTVDIEGYRNRRKGEELKQDLQLVSDPVALITCSRKQPDCMFSLDVFADAADSDKLKNDKSSFYAYGDALVNDILFVLTKVNRCDDPIPGVPLAFTGGGSFDDSFDPSFDIDRLLSLSGGSGSGFCGDDLHQQLAIINDNTYGRYFAYGKSNDFLDNDFIDDYGKKYTGMLIEWRKVLAAHGVGKYQVVVIKKDAFGNLKAECDSKVFCLREYNCNLMDKTVRIDIVNQGLRGSLFDPLNFIDYGEAWTNQIRLRGLFRYRSSSYVKEYNQYGDSTLNAFKPVINEQQAKFTLEVRPVPGWMDWILSTEVMQADSISITDYNLANRHSLVNVPVIIDGDVAPTDNKLMNPHSTIQIELAYGQNNLRKRNSQ